MNRTAPARALLSRRAALARLAGLAGMAASLRSFADERLAQAQAAIAKLLGDREATEGGITLTTPAIAENGNTVPISVEVESPFTADDYVRAIHIFAEENPTPEVVSFQFTPASGRARTSTRIRLARTGRVVALAEMSDGRVLRTANEVKVTIGGCGG